MQVIHGAIYIVVKLFPGLTFLTQRWALLDPVCGSGPCQWPESVWILQQPPCCRQFYQQYHTLKSSMVKALRKTAFHVWAKQMPSMKHVTSGMWMQTGLHPRGCSAKAKCCIDLDLETKEIGILVGFVVGFLPFRSILSICNECDPVHGVFQGPCHWPTSHWEDTEKKAPKIQHWLPQTTLSKLHQDFIESCVTPPAWCDPRSLLHGCHKGCEHHEWHRLTPRR